MAGPLVNDEFHNLLYSPVFTRCSSVSGWQVAQKPKSMSLCRVILNPEMDSRCRSESSSPQASTSTVRPQRSH
jgi:hypothetical protein